MEYLTIQEFAETVGVTPQAIYKRIKGDLAAFVIVENGVKLISKEALTLFKSKQPVTQSSSEAFLKAEVERLTAELEAKQQVINDLTTQVSAQSAKLLEILDRQTTQFQLLLAHQQTSTQQLLNALNPPKPVEPEETVEQPVKKQGLIRKIFSSRR